MMVCPMLMLRINPSHPSLGKFFHFSCFNPGDPDDPAVGLVNGELAIPGVLLRREVFDPVVTEVRATSMVLTCSNMVGFHRFWTW